MSPVPGRVVAVVLNYQHADDTIRCVRALQRSLYRNFSIVVIDNGSAEDVADRLRTELDPLVRFLPLPENLGYAAGNNRGIEVALAIGAELIWLINPDLIVEPDTMTRLVQVMYRYPHAGVVGHRILRGETNPVTIWFNGADIDSSRCGAVAHRDMGKEHGAVRPTGVEPTDYVTGASIMIRSTVLEETGPLPEQYFLYFEETDYCVQAREAGWSVLVDTETVATHYKRSSGFLPAPYYIYYYCRGRLLFAHRLGCLGADLPEDLAEFIAAWRRRVLSGAPEWTDMYDQLVEWAVADGRAGRGGRKPEVELVPSARASNGR